MNSTVIGGAMLPHAPQFFTLPETEDRETVERVKATAAEIGARLKAMTPGLWIIISNDHAEQFFHQAAPAFTIHVGGEAQGAFAGRNFHWKVPSEIGFELVRQMYRQGFDPAFTSTAKIDYAIGTPLTHLEIADPVLPVYVNAYLPPQPTMERCYSFGQAIARIVTALGLQTAIIASGGMSHFPGQSALPFGTRLGSCCDRKACERKFEVVDRLGRSHAIKTGNVELRCWAVAAGALGERKPDIVSMEPSWHHNYATPGWFDTPSPELQPHYPSIKPELVELTTALHGLAHNAEMRRQFLADGAAYADRFRLTPPQRTALLALDMPAMVSMGAHPLVPLLAIMEIERQRRG